MGNELVKRLAEGDSAGITIEHIEGPVLGNAGQVVDQVIEGSVAIIGNSMPWIAPFDQDLLPTSFGFVFRDLDHFKTYFASDVFGEIVDRIANEQGIRVMGVTPLPYSKFFSREPIQSAEDLDGLKLRAPGLEMFVESYKSYGCNPTPIAWNETFLALKTGVVDAAQGPVFDVLPNNWHLAAPNITSLGDMNVPHLWGINENVWQSLSERQQKVLEKTFNEVSAWGLGVALEEESKVIEEMESQGAVYFPSFPDRDVVRAMALKRAKELEASGKWSAGMIDLIDNL